jgi:photosystem II stability/assembly factor-like uncharacterized protein
MYQKTLAFLLLLCYNLLIGQNQSTPLLSSFQEYQQAQTNSLFNTKWKPIGPVTNSARVEAVQVDPQHPNIMFVAFGSGNLWKTTNYGLSWQPIFNNQAATGIGDIALAPSNPNIIYVGTGESLRKNRNFTLPGTGVYRSTDGGEIWQHLGLDNTWHIGEIAVHPQNPDIVFVAALGKFWSKGKAKGLYRSLDGGKNWKRVLFIDDNTRINDIVIAPSNPSILYASAWENNINKPLAQSVFGKKSGIYRSSDGGNTWQKVKNGLPKHSKIGRIGLAVSHQNPNKIYALIDNRKNINDEAAEVYLSENGGKSWLKTHENPLRIFPGIGWYFADIYVNPQNDEEIYCLGVRMAKSRDGGKTFDFVSGNITHIQPSKAQTLHLDHCELWINPLNPNHLALGNDGGLYISHDRGANWLHLNNLPTGEFYSITLDNQQPYQIYGGTQDNATVFGPAKEWQTPLKDVWKYLWIDAWSGGDGCVTQVDPKDANTVYFSMQNGHILRRDVAMDTSKVIAPKRQFKDLLNYNFIAPYFLSPHQHQTLYHGGNYLMKSTNRGDTWEKISPNLANSTFSKKQSIAAGAIAESTRQAGLLYVGTDKGAFWCSKDDGKNWQEYSKGIANHYIRSIYPSKFKTARVYMAMTGINHDDLNHYLYVSEDYGQNWKSIAANLPHEPVNVIIEDPKQANILYAGTHRGVFISINRGQNWHLLGDNLPAASVADLQIQERENELVAATHGRGIYVFDLDVIHQLYSKGFPMSNNYLFPPPAAIFPKREDTHRNIDKSTLRKIPLSFWLEKAEKVELSVVNDNEKVLWKKEINGKKGLNQFRWNLVRESVKSD